MPRRPRLHLAGAFYHVTLRGNHRQPIFFCDEDRLTLGRIVSSTLVRYEARAHAYCWMGNHIHLLLQVSDAPLGRIMMRVASAYARSVQASLDTTGHLFERRYHAVLVDADRYMLALLRYIHLNPVRAGLVRRADDYPWSSHHAYSGRHREDWLTTDFVLQTLGLSRRTAARRYRQLMDGTAGIAAASPLEQINSGDPRVLGDDGFLQRLPRPIADPKTPVSIDELITETCRRHGVEPDDILSGSRRRCLTRARAWLAHEVVSRRAGTLSGLARRLGRDESTLRELLLRHHPPRQQREVETPETPDPAPERKSPLPGVPARG